MHSNSAPEELYFAKVPKKNAFVVGLMFLRFPLWFPFVKSIIRSHLKHCSDVDFTAGFRFLYGNLFASKVFFSDTFFVDYAPIYIGENSFFGFENIVITATHDFKNRQHFRARPIRIGRNVWISSRCIILGGVTIGDNAVIGAGSVVAKDVPANAVVAGNPACVVRMLPAAQ